MHLRQSTKIKIVGLKDRGRLARGPLDLGAVQSRLDRADDTARYLVLKLENVLERSVEIVSPDMRA